MTVESDLKNWKQILDVAHKKHKNVEKKIDRSWEYFKGNQWSTTSDGWDVAGYKDKTVDNVIYSNLRAIVPRLNYRNPKIFVRPKKKPFRTKTGMFDTIAASVYFELVLNYYYKVLEIKREARKCIYDAFLAPWGIMELGYTLKTEKIKNGDLIEINELIQEDSPFCKRRDPKDFRVDPECVDSNLHDARWIALRWVKSLEDIKKDPKYTNTANLKPNFRVKTDFESIRGGMKPEDPAEDNMIWRRVEGWTIWDRKERRIMDAVKEHDKFLRNENKWPLDIEGFPVETLYFTENATDCYPVPDIWMVLDLQDELNRIGSLQLDHIRRISQRRYIARENAFQEEEMRKLTHGGDGTVATSSLDPQSSIYPLTDATISQDIHMIRNGVKDIIRQAMGVSSTEAMQSVRYDQATEPALIEQASQSIRGDQQQIFEDFLVRVVEKLAVIIQQTSDKIEIPLTFEQMNDAEIQKFIGGKMVKIAGEEGAVLLQPWLELEKADIQGDYLYEIEIGSTMPINEQSQRQDAITMYQLLSQNPFVKAREGTRLLLEAFDVPDPEKMLKPEDQVKAEKKERMQSQIQFEQAVDAPKRQADLAKTAAKTQSNEKIAALKTRQGQFRADLEDRADAMRTRAKFLGDMLKARRTGR